MDDDASMANEEGEHEFVIATETIPVTTYSASARQAMQLAAAYAIQTPAGVLTTEHLLLALASDPDCAAARVLASCGFPGETVVQTIAFIGGPQTGTGHAEMAINSPRVERIVANAQTEAGTRAAEQIDTLHLLFALIRERQGVAAAALESPGVGLEIVGAALSNAFRTGLTDPS